MRAHHVYPDGVIRIVCVLRVNMRCVARVLRRRSPYSVGMERWLSQGRRCLILELHSHPFLIFGDHGNSKTSFLNAPT